MNLKVARLEHRRAGEQHVQRVRARRERLLRVGQRALQHRRALTCERATHPLKSKSNANATRQANALRRAASRLRATHESFRRRGEGEGEGVQRRQLGRNNPVPQAEPTRITRKPNVHATGLMGRARYVLILTGTFCSVLCRTTKSRLIEYEYLDTVIT